MIAVHFVGGMLGTLLLGLFGNAGSTARRGRAVPRRRGRPAVAPARGVVCVVAFSFVLTWLIAAGVQALIGLRVPPADEERLDQAQQGADAYHLGGVTSLTAPGAPRRRTAAAPAGEPAVPSGQRVRVVTALLEPDPAANSADLRDALLRAGAISVIVSDAAVATTTPQASLLPRGYWQDQPLAARLRVTVLVGADGVAAVLDELDRMGAVLRGRS